jgi:hypothetical protein
MNMKNKWVKKLVTFGLATVMMLSTCVPAFAFVDESQTTDAVLEEEFTGEELETEAATETEAESEQPAFSVEGNGTVLDDVTDSSGKEFYTIQTANNNTYFLVIDHSSTVENVYMLSMIDENDLKEFLDEESETETTVIQPTVVLDEDTTETEAEAVVEETPSNTQSTGNSPVGLLAILAFLGAAVAGGYYYLKFYKPQKEGRFSDGEDLEYLDEGETINEDDLSSNQNDAQAHDSDDEEEDILIEDEEE